MTFPGLILCGDQLIMFETQFTLHWLEALEEGQLSELQQIHFPITYIHGNGKRNNELRNSKNFFNKPLLAGYSIADENDLARALMIFNELTINRKKQGNFNVALAYLPEIFSEEENTKY